MQPRKLISFDLQGTLSASRFSDEFWLELLPALHADRHNMTLEQSRDQLENEFRSKGRYDAVFYDHRLRLNNLLAEWDFLTLVNRLKNKPVLYRKMIHTAKNIPPHIPCILLSATTRDFIDHELGFEKQYFYKIISSIDDYATAGKPPSLYRKISREMGILPEHCLHIGDCMEMDIINARSAGWQTFHIDKMIPPDDQTDRLQATINNFICRDTLHDQ